MKSNTSYRNNRSINENNNYFGVLGGTLKKIISPVLDILRPSRREDIVVKLRPYQNIKAPVMNSYTFNQYDAPEITSCNIHMV